MDQHIKAFLIFGAVLLIGTAWIVWVSSEQKIADKAAQYEVYKNYIEEFKKCLPAPPIVMCALQPDVPMGINVRGE